MRPVRVPIPRDPDPGRGRHAACHGVQREHLADPVIPAQATKVRYFPFRDFGISPDLCAPHDLLTIFLHNSFSTFPLFSHHSASLCIIPYPHSLSLLLLPSSSSFFLFHLRTGLFSATQTKELKELARAGLRNPVSVTVQVTKKVQSNTTENNGNSGNTENNEVKKSTLVQQTTPSGLENFYMTCAYDERPFQLSLFIMKNLKRKIIVFCATCACVDYYSEMFSKMTKTSVKVKNVEGEGEMDVQSVTPGSSSSSSNSNNIKTNNNTNSSYLPSCIHTLGFHGKMVPKKRALLYKKFLALQSGNVDRKYGLIY